MKKSPGYSLIELVIVLTLIGIVSVGIFVYVGFYGGAKLDSASQKLISDIRYAQSLAMSTTGWYGVSFEASPINIYTVYSTTGTIDSAVKDPSNFAINLIVDTNSLFGATIFSVAIEGGQKIEFNPLGQPYADKLGNPLTLESSVVLKAGSDTKTIKITPNTGRVYLQ